MFIACALLALGLGWTATAGRAAQAPTVTWCGTYESGGDEPDAVAGPQVHVIYAFPKDGVDRFHLLATGIASDLSAVAVWWQHQDYSRVPRFDLRPDSCFPSLGALDISWVRLPQDPTYFLDTGTRLVHLRDALVAYGFDNPYKKYLVYYDSPIDLPGDICGEGHEDPKLGGPDGYAAVYLAPNLTSGPTSSGCGSLDQPDAHGGYSAITAAHELLHTFGALDTWDTPGPPHACPGSPAHACDNPLDIMEPAGQTFWLDNLLLDAGHDDYYGHSGTWWDVQDSQWLRHLNQPTRTLNVSLGDGAAEVLSDVPGVYCRVVQPCVTTWDDGSAVVLHAYQYDTGLRVVWGGACASAGASPECSLTMSADTNVTVSFIKPLALSWFTRHATRTQVKAVLELSRVPLLGEAGLSCSATPGLTLVASAINGATASCTWNVPAQARGKRVKGHMEVSADDGTTVARDFSVVVPR